MQGCTAAGWCGMAAWVPISEAARLLGVSADTVKRRIAAGQLRSRQEQRPQGYRWLVEVPDEAILEPEEAAEEHVESDKRTSETTALAVYRAEIARLEETVHLMMEELDVRRREVAELHHLLRDAVAGRAVGERLPNALPDGGQEPGQHGKSGHPRRWWPPWQGSSEPRR